MENVILQLKVLLPIIRAMPLEEMKDFNLHMWIKDIRDDNHAQQIIQALIEVKKLCM